MDSLDPKIAELSLFYQIVDEDTWRRDSKRFSGDVKIYQRGDTPDLRKFRKLEKLTLTGRKAYTIITESKFPTSLKHLSAVDVNAGDKITHGKDGWGHETTNVIESHMVIPAVIKQLKHLTYLNLSNNNVYPIHYIGYLSSLETLILNKCGIDKLYSNFACMINLQELDLGNNAIDTFPECIGSMKSLKVLKLGNNRISTFPILNLLHLEHLDLSRNKFNTFPLTITRLTSLIHLDLTRCRIDFVDIKKLINLKRLFLYGTNLIDLRSITPPYQLEYIQFDFRIVRNLPDILLRQHLSGLLEIVNENKESWANVKDLEKIFASLQEICLKKASQIKDPSTIGFPYEIERQLLVL